MQKHNNNYIFLTDTSTSLKGVALSSYGISIMTFITFAFAMIAVPISGANAPNGSIPYPYLDTIQQYPRDYIWQYLAMCMICIYLINVAVIRTAIKKEKQVYVQLACIFSILSSIVLLINYFVQVNVVPISLMHQEYEGIALITQYNPHGIFIALEQLGYIMMSISFGFLIPVFRAKETKAISVIYLIAVILAVVGFIFIHAVYGLDKQDRYEVIIIVINWLVLTINGILTGNKARKVWKEHRGSGTD